MSDAPLTFTTLVGSLRKGSYNAALARALVELAPDDVEVVPAPLVGDIPLYNADVQDTEGFPARVLEIAEAIRAADGLIFVTPEYNYSVPGVLKNAIDWLSRLDNQPFAGKPTLIQSVSRGNMGGVRAQLHLRHILVFARGMVFPAPEVLVGAAPSKFDEAGRLSDEATREHVAKHLAAFADFVRRVS